MMKSSGLISLILFCVLIAQVVDGRKHHRKRGGTAESVLSKGEEQIARHEVQQTARTNSEADQADNKAREAEENQKNDTLIADGREVLSHHAAKHRRGHKGKGVLHFRRKDESKHDNAHHKRRFHKRNHGKPGRHNNDVRVAKENLSPEMLALNSNMPTEKKLKRLLKMIKRRQHMRRKHDHKRQEEKVN